jgi:phosphatidylinositol glycan class U
MARMGNVSLISILALMVPVSLFVLDHWMWLETGSGNANFIYFQCLAYNVFVAAILLDFVAGSVMRQKVLRYTEKHSFKKTEETTSETNE